MKRFRYYIQFIAKVFAESFQPQLSVDMVSAANNQKNDDCVKVLRQKDETKK